ncbi:GNAT family N-acetyltransferase [Nocardia paucivorans]|uniref:GNAT family N-acetyltransferase n=1 Tax=Nocardia paucivorans TaxID=114259 RepID=UPI0002EB5F33|nr:GNAT family N-acetyltransferase [Nocardia paucivorans]
MTESTVQSRVTRNDDRRRYEIFYGDNLAGFAEYVERPEQTVFTHTEVDSAFGGKGLGSKLAEYAVRDTIERGRTIVPRCEFIKAYLDKHPEYGAHIADEDTGGE